MEEDSFEFLRTLVETPSPSGYEEENLMNWRDRVEGHAEKIEADSYGNTTATLNPGCDTSVVLTGHSDEISFMVRHITEEGFIYVQRVGGMDVGVAQGQRVVIHGREGPVKGVVGRKAIHLQEDEDKEEQPDLEDIYIDIGAENEEEVREAGVHVGATATYNVGLDRLQGDVVAGRALDNRIGIWAAAEAFLAIDPSELDVTVHAVATVQEEVGLKGATMVSYSLNPDVALVVDVTHATDNPDTSFKKYGKVEMGEGPVLKHGRENHPLVNEHLREIAEGRGIPLQEETMSTRGGTDADAFFVSRGGIPSTSVGVPNRYMHTTAELIDLKDLEGVRELFAGFAESLNGGEDFRKTPF
ncbi:MAG: M42 family metallopeptidase [Halobacteria archaeon]|nr:M42 family metallopeptidase [Halobacteria archaeon]